MIRLLVGIKKYHDQIKCMIVVKVNFHLKVFMILKHEDEELQEGLLLQSTKYYINKYSFYHGIKLLSLP